jgi:hypothetical protein
MAARLRCGTGRWHRDPCPRLRGDHRRVRGQRPPLAADRGRHDLTASEHPLINDCASSFPASMDTLNFGADGYLYVSAARGKPSTPTTVSMGPAGARCPEPVRDPPAGVGGAETPPRGRWIPRSRACDGRGRSRGFERLALRVDPAIAGLPATRSLPARRERAAHRRLRSA